MVRACDVSKLDECQELISWAEQKLPDLNVLVNNAGIQRDIDFSEGATQYFAGENEIRVNIEAPIILSGLFVPLLKQNKNSANSLLGSRESHSQRFCQDGIHSSKANVSIPCGVEQNCDKNRNFLERHPAPSLLNCTLISRE